jgi:hypothetical protein
MRQRLSEIGWRTAVVLVLQSTHSTAGLAAQDQPLNAAALFLLFPVGAQAVGMGQTAVAADGHGEVVFENPAGVATLSSSEFALHTATLAAGPTTALTAFFPRHGIGVFGATLYLADYGDQDLTDSAGTTNGRLASRNFAFLATYATQLTGWVSLGVSYKLVQFAASCSGVCQSVTSGQGVTHALDIGGQFAVGADRALRIGVALRNVGFPLQVNNRDQADPLPTRLTVGAAYRLQLRPVDDDSLADRFDVRMAADVESPWRQTGNPDIRLGVDVGYRQLVRVRGGYAFLHQGLSGPSIGVGVATGAIGVDLARMFLTGTDLVTPNPTFLSFRVAF